MKWLLRIQIVSITTLKFILKFNINITQYGIFCNENIWILVGMIDINLKCVTRNALLSKWSVTFWLNFFMHGWALNVQVVALGSITEPVETIAATI